MSYVCTRAHTSSSQIPREHQLVMMIVYSIVDLIGCAIAFASSASILLTLGRLTNTYYANEPLFRSRTFGLVAAALSVLSFIKIVLWLAEVSWVGWMGWARPSVCRCGHWMTRSDFCLFTTRSTSRLGCPCSSWWAC